MKRGINDKLKQFIEWAIECYEVAAHPPALNYSRRVDVTYRDDVNGYSRSYLLRLGIDAKSAVNDTMRSLPESRAKVLRGWIVSEENYYWHNLTESQQFYLKMDRKTLLNRVKGKNNRPPTMQLTKVL